MDWLRQAILKAGGFAKVAEATGISVPHLYAIVRGERSLTARSARKLAPALPKVGKLRWTSSVLDLSAMDKSANADVKRKAASAAAV